MSKHRGGTNTVHEVKLTSAIEQVQWKERIGTPGHLTQLVVLTHFVGNNAELKIELTDHVGKKVGSFDARLFGNQLRKNVLIPQNAKTALYATAKLPKHGGLQMKSGPLLLPTPYSITHAQWDRDTVIPGEALKLSADVKGLPDGTEVEVSVWEHDDGGAHERMTKFPALVKGGQVQADWAFEYYGDLEAALAATTGKPLQFFYRVSYAGTTVQSNLIKLLWVVVELVGEDEKPIVDERYEIKLPDGTTRSGVLNQHGRATIIGIPQEGTCKVSFPNIDKDAWESLT